MTVLALTLILVSSVIHATWNLFAKRANGGAPLICLYDMLSVALYTPIVLLFILIAHTRLTLLDFLFILVSGLLELGYFLLLQRGYRVGDLSVVYPVARGTGPMLSTILAILLFRERPSLLALLGTALIVCGVFTIASGKHVFVLPRARLAVIYGVLVGVFIASYTLWDKQAVSVLLIPPLLLNYGTAVVRVGSLLPYAVSHWGEVRLHWKLHRMEAFGIAILNPLSYIMVLTALTFTPVSYVAPSREVSVLFGIVLGARLLAEGDIKRRLIAAGMIVTGVIALAI